MVREFAIPAGPAAPRVAQHWVMRTAAGLGVGGAANQTLEMLTAELVAAAVKGSPSGSELMVRLQVDTHAARVAVAGAAGFAAASATTVALVEALASACGTFGGPAGATAWFAVALTD